MATTPATPAIRERHALWLSGVRPDVEEIPQLAGEWATLADGERASWSHTWDQDMGAVENLVLAAHRGELDADHRRELETLVRRLEELAPMIEALGLWVPELRDPIAIGRRGHGSPVAMPDSTASSKAPIGPNGERRQGAGRR